MSLCVCVYMCVCVCVLNSSCFRAWCHRTADICENALEICETSHGPRTRRCHLRYRACRTRFTPLNSKKFDDSQTTSATSTAVLVVAMMNNNETLRVSQSWFTRQNVIRSVDVLSLDISFTAILYLDIAFD